MYQPTPNKTLLLVVASVTLKYISCIFDSKLPYRWREENDNLDFIVGVSFDDVPVSAGVLITEFVAITGANPFYGFHKTFLHTGNSEDHVLGKQNLLVHVIYKNWDRCKAIRVMYVFPQIYNPLLIEKDKIGLFEKWSNFSDYSPIHDIIALTLEVKVTGAEFNLTHRYPLRIYMAQSRRVRIDGRGTFTIAGFGFVDKIHVKRMMELEAVDYRVDEVLVDCDEWLPRPWGFFLCVYNIENFVGIDSGASLLYNGYFVGLGSFSLTRGNESILVFTNIQAYKFVNYTKQQYGGGTTTMPNNSMWDHFP